MQWHCPVLMCKMLQPEKIQKNVRGTPIVFQVWQPRHGAVMYLLRARWQAMAEAGVERIQVSQVSCRAQPPWLSLRIPA